MKKILPFLLVISFVLNGLGAAAITFNTNSFSFEDELDQFQTEMTENAVMPIGQIPIPDDPLCLQVAQSFVPSKNLLTKLELFIGKNSTVTYPFVVEIKENLVGDYLTQQIVDPSIIPTEDFDWVEINIDDIAVTVGNEYFIVTHTVNVTDNFYAWGANNISESYPFGCMYYSIDDGGSWTNESASSNPTNYEEFINLNGAPTIDEYVTWDMCFKTYGCDNFAPEKPEISGPASGKPGISYTYNFRTKDPNEDDLYYYIDWDDDSPIETVGPLASGSEGTATHKWTDEGSFVIRIKAADIYGAESDWSQFKVSLPRNRVANNFLFKLLDQFPILHLFFNF